MKHVAHFLLILNSFIVVSERERTIFSFRYCKSLFTMMRVLFPDHEYALKLFQVLSFHISDTLGLYGHCNFGFSWLIGFTILHGLLQPTLVADPRARFG